MDSPNVVKAVVHVAEGALPVEVHMDLERWITKGSKRVPARVCVVTRSAWGYKAGFELVVSLSLITVKGTQTQDTTSGRARRKANAAKHRAKMRDSKRHGHGGHADGRNTPVPTEDAQSAAKPIGTELAPFRTPVVYERPEMVRAARSNPCDGGCGTELVFFETLLTGSRITTCPACKAAYSA